MLWREALNVIELGWLHGQESFTALLLLQLLIEFEQRI
jgi:hypothetical protein